jgi:general secretion pathway protein F
MAAFKYEAMDAAGKRQTGVLEVDTLRQARQKLREMGLIPYEIGSITAAAGHAAGAVALRRRLPVKELSLLTRQFATLLNAGLTMEQTLNALIDQAESEVARQVLAGVRAEVLAGHTLARAMEKFPQAFPELYPTLVHAGEQSGQLDEVLQRLADYTDERNRLRQKIIAASVYPIILTLVAIGVVTGLLTYVVPQVVTVFQNTHQALPLLTRALLALSAFVKATWWGWLVGLAGAAAVVRRALKQDTVRYRFHQRLLRLPLLGPLLRGVNSARLASTLAILAGSGVPLLAALEAGARVVWLLPMREAVEGASRRVQEGGSLARALAKSKVFPTMMLHLIASGESSGKLDQMLDRAAVQQAQDMESRIATLTSLLEPLLILAMGGMVLLIVLAILMPIFDMNQLKF